MEETGRAEVALEDRTPGGSSEARVRDGLLEQLRWSINYLHDLTVLTDAKAGFVIAVAGALIGGTLAAHEEIRDVLLRDAACPMWIPRVLWGAFVVVLGFTLFLSLEAVRPRSYKLDKRGSTVPIFHAEVAKKYWSRGARAEVGVAQGDLWARDLRQDWDGGLADELAANGIVMSEIVGVKINFTNRAMRCLLGLSLCWIFAIAVTFVCYVREPSASEPMAPNRSPAVESSR